MVFYTQELTQFKGKINNTKFHNEEHFWAVQNILRQIDDVFTNDNCFPSDIYFPENFLDDLSSEIKNIYLKYEDETYSEISNTLIDSIWFEKEDLSDLQFNYMDIPHWFDFINENLANLKYDFKTPTPEPE